MLFTSRIKVLTVTQVALAFLTIILLLTSMGGIAVFEIYNLKKDVENIYKHPFTVSNSAREINVHLNAMHRSMKDVVLSKNAQELEDAVVVVDLQEKMAFENFEVIFDRFLGDKSEIQELHKNFVNWKNIRDRVIALARKGKAPEAAEITKSEGAVHVALLEKQTQSLVIFAFAKAAQFNNKAIANEKRALVAVSVLFVISLVVAVYISFWVVRELRKSRSEAARQNNLIDQNILIARLDSNGLISDISNHLARMTGRQKSELINQGAFNILTGDGGQDEVNQILNIARSGKIWSGEHRRIDDQGGIHWLLTKVHPEFDEKFEVISFTVLCQDVSDKKISVTDKLTGLPNRRSFDATIEHEIRLARRDEKYLTLAILDLDYFKKYNDLHGHPKGDYVLSEVSKMLKETMRRPGDYVSRIGGEEFAILFGDHDLAQARKTLELVCTSIENLKIKHGDSVVSKYVTISIGAVVVYGGDIKSVGELYENADQVLYRAKQTRNTVIVQGSKPAAVSSTS